MRGAVWNRIETKKRNEEEEEEKYIFFLSTKVMRRTLFMETR
jgi:hypothetical protein